MHLWVRDKFVKLRLTANFPSHAYSEKVAYGCLAEAGETSAISRPIEAVVAGDRAILGIAEAVERKFEAARQNIVTNAVLRHVAREI